MKRALITGISGQDGSYLTEHLLRHGYEVHGLVRRSSSGTARPERLAHLLHEENPASTRVHLHHGDVLDSSRLRDLLDRIQPQEVYNLAAQSDVGLSFDNPVYTVEVAALGALRVLEAIRCVGGADQIRFYQASSSEIFGRVAEIPQTESTPLRPQSPYACAKAFSFFQTANYREAYGMHASNGILFNHESPRRGEMFVTRKITCGLARIVAGRQKYVNLGNLDARRDWGYAPDYVDAMWRMLQCEQPDDYVIATGQTWSIRDFLTRAFSLVGLDWSDYVRFDPLCVRPTDVDVLLGDSAKARQVLGWEPAVGFDDLVRLMVTADLRSEGVDGTGDVVEARAGRRWQPWGESSRESA